MKERPPLTDQDPWPFGTDKGTPLGQMDDRDIDFMIRLKEQDVLRWKRYRSDRLYRKDDPRESVDPETDADPPAPDQPLPF